MGVQGLARVLKVVAGEDVDLREGGGGVILVDGHFIMHQTACTGGVAEALVLNEDEVPLFRGVAARLERLVEAGWLVVVVFDGATPPGKLGTSQRRLDNRERALSNCRDAKANLNGTGARAQVQRFARNAVRFSPLVTAKVAKRLAEALRVQCIIAPFEADPQLKLLEEMFTRMGKVCYVYATDSDLVVLGVRRLLYDIDISLQGRYISRAKLLVPQEDVLGKTDSFPHTFLRLLHGIYTEDELRGGVLQLADEATVTARLLWYACTNGNDYSKLPGVGERGAVDVSLRRQSAKTTLSAGETVIVGEMAEHLAARPGIGLSAAEVVASISKAKDMFSHGVAFDPTTGEHRHLSGQDPTPALSLLTGSFSSPHVAKGIATIKYCPVELHAWDPPIAARLGNQGGLGVGGVGVLNKRSRLDASRETSTDHLPGDFRELPPPNTNLDAMTKLQLFGFVGQFRCFESSGLSTAKKATLLELAKKAVRVVNRARLVNSELAMRRPFKRSTKEEILRRRLPDLPAQECWVDNWESLRIDLPEMSEAVIVEWFQQGSPQLNIGSTSRVLYRGLQRTMDLGVLRGLRGVPSGPGNIMWLQLSTTPSMRAGVYQVYAVVKVGKLYDDGIDDAYAEDGDSDCDSDEDLIPDPIDGERPRLVATQVVDAFCTCQAGLPGACHHVCQLLQVVRLLQMTARELRAWDPETVTGRACAWLLKNARAGRDPTDNVFWRMQLSQIGSELRTLRDPKKQQNGSEQPAHTKGVVVGDRSQDFNPHPSGGVWAEREEHFNKGVTMSRRKWNKFDAFIKKESRGEERAVYKNPPLLSDTCYES